MDVLFTTRDSLSSKIIRTTTGEPFSHCAIEAYGFVVHSSFRGVIIEPLSKFKENNIIVDKVNVGKGNSKLLKALSDSYGKSYDVPALFYLGLKLLLKKVGISLPKKNLWQTTGMYLCTEFVTHVLDGEEDSLLTPGQLLDKLRSN